MKSDHSKKQTCSASFPGGRLVDGLPPVRGSLILRSTSFPHMFGSMAIVTRELSDGANATARFWLDLENEPDL